MSRPTRDDILEYLRGSRKEANLLAKISGGAMIAGKIGVNGALLAFGLVPASLGLLGGIAHSKLTDPDDADFEAAQRLAVTEDLRSMTERLKTLPARKAERSFGREGIWRP